MIDLHSHILPGVDDGAQDLDEAVAMCRQAHRDGCQALVATPHLRHEQWWNGDRGKLEGRFQQLCAAVGDEIELHLGGEIAVSSESCRELEELPHGDLLTLAGSRYLLLELPYHGYGPEPVELVHELVVDGWFPIIAHPERIPWLVEEARLIDRLVEHGATLQLTAKCVTGDYGKHLKQVSCDLLDRGLVHFVASDAHNLRLRSPGLHAAFKTVEKTWGQAAAQQLLVEHPRAVLQDRPLPAPAALGPHP